MKTLTLVLTLLTLSAFAKDCEVYLSYSGDPCRPGGPWTGDVCTTYQAGTATVSIGEGSSSLTYHGKKTKIACAVYDREGSVECRGDNGAVVIDRPREQIFYVSFQYNGKYLSGNLNGCN